MVRPKSKMIFWCVVIAFVALGVSSACRGQNVFLDTLVLPDTVVFGGIEGGYVTVRMLGGDQMPPYVIEIHEPDTVEALYVKGRRINISPYLDTTAVFIAGISIGLLISIMMMVGP